MDPTNPHLISPATLPTSGSRPLKKSRLVLVRHSKPDIDESIPSTRWPLSPSSRNGAASLAEKLRDFTFKKVASSPEVKAFETAEIIAEKLGLETEIDNDLSEHARHSVQFLPRREDFEAQIAQLFNNSSDLVFGEETADAALKHFKSALDKQFESAAGEDVLVVSHGTVMSIYVSHRLGLEPLPFWRSLSTPKAMVISGNGMGVLEA